MSRSPQASPTEILELLSTLLAHAPRPPHVRRPVEPDGGPGRASAEGAEGGNPPAERPPASGIIDVEALRRLVRSSDPVSVGAAGAAHEVPAHIDHAKRIYLAVLITELGGDLPLIAKFWDRRSEKTIRKLVRRYGLTEELARARARGPRRQDEPVAPTGPRRQDEPVVPIGPRRQDEGVVPTGPRLKKDR